MKQPPKQPWYIQVREQIRGYLFDNLPLKGLAALIVTAVWLSVAGQTRPRAETMLHDIDVSLRNVPPYLTVVGTEPDLINVRVRGPEDAIRELRLASRMRATDLVASVDLINTEQGTYKKPLTIQNLPDHVEVQEIYPAPFARVTLEPLATREVRVRPRLIGEVPPGYKRVGLQVTPTVVTIRGPESRVREIEELNTTTVNLTGHTATFTESVEVDILEPGSISTVGPSQVALRVEIVEETGEYTIENVPVTVPGQPGAVVTPAEVSVTLRGPMPVLNGLTAANLTAIVPGDGPAVRSATPEVTVDVPEKERIEVARVSPPTVRVRR
jgi:YbbR domain-containing protein